DGAEYPASLDWTAHSPKEFYDLMRAGKRITTTQVPRELYVSAFSEQLKQGKDIVYVACSSALSGSWNLSTLVAKELETQYPERKVYCVDSLISSLGQAAIAVRAAELRAQGKSATEVAEHLIENRLRFNQCGSCDTLEYLARAGRVKASKAFFGNLFGVKPILISDKIGQNYAVKKAKGAGNARIAIADGIAEVVENSADQVLYISHADNLQAAEQVRDLILQRAPFANVHIDYITPIVGSCVGPGTIIVFCYGKEVTVQGE
ncbi:MAG: DegV family protein, partial [Clostridia bacterium]|nr:DegV family protein [Clostridia bacterium]